MRLRSLARFSATLVIALAVAGYLAHGMTAEDNFDQVQAGPISYKIPARYNAENDSTDGVFFQVRLSDWGPLQENKPGWNDNVNILITHQPDPIAKQYDTLWDGTPVGNLGKWATIERTYRIEPEFTVQEMGSSFDIIVPDQDRSMMPLGVMECTRPNPPVFPNASCKLRFDRDGQRWTITFGRQFLHRYGEFRERTTSLLDQFHEVQR